MKTIEIPTDDSVETFRSIREKIYEETKDMTLEEVMDYERKQLAEFHRLITEVNPADYDLSFLHTPQRGFAGHHD